jgi:Pyridoxamine 5'-phosphate oxidase
VNAQEITASLAAPHIAVVATVHRYGAPQLTPNGYRYDGQVLTLITRKGRLKYRHLLRDHRLSVGIDDPPAASNESSSPGPRPATTRTSGTRRIGSSLNDFICKIRVPSLARAA